MVTIPGPVEFMKGCSLETTLCSCVMMTLAKKYVEDTILKIRRVISLTTSADVPVPRLVSAGVPIRWRLQHGVDR